MNYKTDITSICFLCKGSSEVTYEHVFPKWLQHDYNLWDQFMLLRNGTKYQYRKLTIPCCKTCNGTHLSNLENKISSLIRNNDVSSLRKNSNDTFIWLYKIMYGLHYKEIFLKENLKDPLSNSIAPKDKFLNHDARNLFPLFVLGSIHFDKFNPYSLFVFSLSDSHPNKYFYVDEPDQMFLSIVLGKIGIICSFQCDGYIEKDINRIMKISERNELSLSEFADLSSFIFNLKARMNVLPNYLMTLTSEKITFRIQESHFNGRYKDLDIKKQMEIVVKCYSSFFDKETELDTDGQKKISYQSPFIYF